MANSFVQPRQHWARIMNGNSRLGSKGLFIWSRLTGLAIFPRSRLTSKSFVKFSMCSYERASSLGSRDLGKRAWNFAKWTLHHGYPDERRDEFWRSGWHRLVLPAVFSTSQASHLALSVTDAKIGPKVKILCFAMFALFPEFGARTRPQDLWPFLISEIGLTFLIWTQGKIHQVTEASRSTGLIWRGPNALINWNPHPGPMWGNVGDFYGIWRHG